MRRIFGNWIAGVAKKNNKLILVVGDIGYGIFDKFRQNFPDRFFNVGTCEQAMISYASGLALAGLYPYVYTITPFLIERGLEQIKLDICANNANVKLVGYCDYPEQGVTHQLLLKPKYLKSLGDIQIHENEATLLDDLNASLLNSTPMFFNLKKSK